MVTTNTEPTEEPAPLPDLTLFNQLPVDVWHDIFFQLPTLKELARICLVCKQWKHLAEDDLVWSKVYERKWGQEKTLPAGDNFKQRYHARLVYQIQLDAKPASVQDFVERLPRLIVDLTGSDKMKRLESATVIRRMLSIEKNPPIQEVVDANAIDPLLKLVGDDTDPRLQFEAAWAVTNIASGTSTQCTAVVAAGAIDLFVKCLASPSVDVAEQAIWAIGNIAGDNPNSRDLILQSGAVQGAVTLLASPHATRVSVIRNTIWAMSNMCRGKV